MEDHTGSVANHYTQEDIAGAILRGVQSTGKALHEITIDDLAPADEVHTRGREATAELANLATFSAALRVLDVGSGIGGPARYLASTYGCRVIGVDLTPSFCRAAEELTQVVGLAEKVSFECTSALDMPFPDNAFDVAWTVQMQMNIADKPRLYREIARVLKPGGTLVFQDIVKGEGGDLFYPVPWASEAAHSHLAPAASLHAAITSAGFEQKIWRDMTSVHKAWTQAQGNKPKPDAPPAVGIHQVLGPNAFEKRRNSSRCLMQDSIGFVQGVFRKSIVLKGAGARSPNHHLLPFARRLIANVSVRRPYGRFRTSSRGTR